MSGDFRINYEFVLGSWKLSLFKLYYLIFTGPHDVSTQTNISIFTAVGTSFLKWLYLVTHIRSYVYIVQYIVKLV